MRGLLDAVIAIGSDLELEAMLRRVVEAAVELVDARYGALGVIGDGKQFAQFIPVGFSDDEIKRIRQWPEGHGLLGVLVQDPRSLRLAEISGHPASSGFPPGHPVMRTFLGVPIRVRDQVFGNLYFAEKRTGGEFTEEDEAVLGALGSAAGVAIENARLYDEARRQQRWLRATADVVTQLLSGETPDKVLATVTKRTLELSGADLVTLEIPDDDGHHLTVVNAEGIGAEGISGMVIPSSESLARRVMDAGEPLFVADLASEQRANAAIRGAMSHIGASVVFPLGVPGNVRGVIIVGRQTGGPAFTPNMTALVASFAGQAGVALELAAGRAYGERLSVYEDRDRIARDLHDLVIQRLYATGMSLEGTMPLVTRPEVRDRIGSAVDAMDDTIKDIRASIFALQARGMKEPAFRADILGLVDEMAGMLGFAPTLRLGGGLNARIPSSLGDQALTVLREALSNVARHAGATKADVTVDVDHEHLTVTVLDNGCGIQPGTRRSGLSNLAERARALHGDLTVCPGSPDGTLLIWRVPMAAEPEEVPARLPAAGRYPLR
jgi:signal transduction histidine kinase